MADPSLEVTIPEFLYQRLHQEAESLGLSPHQAILEAIKLFCDRCSLKQELKRELETELKAYVQSLLGKAPAPPKTEIPPSIRPLRVGDLVQIRDRDSPFYLQTARIISTTLIRATVDIGSAKHNFLKRDLRYIPPDHDQL